jgi:hypothetical protein
VVQKGRGVEVQSCGGAEARPVSALLICRSSPLPLRSSAPPLLRPFALRE